MYHSRIDPTSTAAIKTHNHLFEPPNNPTNLNALARLMTNRDRQRFLATLARIPAASEEVEGGDVSVESKIAWDCADIREMRNRMK